MMFWGIFFGFVFAAAVIRTELFWEGLCGLALFGFVAGVFTLDVGMAVFSFAVLVGCIARWAWVA